MNSTIGKFDSPSLPRIAITTGDPAGIGPEICWKLITNGSFQDVCLPVFLGDLAAFELLGHSNKLAEYLDVVECSSIQAISHLQAPTFIDFQHPEIKSVGLGTATACGGNASFKYLEAAIRWAQDGFVDGVTTGPINKLALHLGGHHYPGHTEILAEKTATSEYCMMQFSDQLTCSFVTTHVGYAEVPKLLSTERILQVIKLSVDALRTIRNKEPKLVVCGLNPHAGEDGLFGDREEEKFIVPAIEAAQAIGFNVKGPFPPDTCFIPSQRATIDCFVCMYHDQGHIPLKALVFDEAVNITLGLPIIRTSVDHGTAYDIVGTNQADPSSLQHAVKLAAKLAAKKHTLC